MPDEERVISVPRVSGYSLVDLPDVTAAVLRIEVDGGWSAREMAALFDTFDTAYNTAAAVLSMGMTPSSAPVNFGTTWTTASSADVTAGVLAFGPARHGPLRVGAIRYESPGFLEFLASLNPLKVVLDHIEHRRDQDLQRKRDEVAAEAAKEVREDRRRANDQAFVLAVLDRTADLPPQQREETVGRLLGLWPAERLDTIAHDQRVRALDLRAA